MYRYIMFKWKKINFKFLTLIYPCTYILLNTYTHTHVYINEQKKSEQKDEQKDEQKNEQKMNINSFKKYK